MSFRRIDAEMMLQGTVLAMVHLLFGDRIPTVEEHARANGVSPSTFRRAADWVITPLRRLLLRRRPGPVPGEKPDSAAQAREKLRDLASWLRTLQSETATNACFSPEAKQRIAALSEEISTNGAMGYGEIAAELGIDPRQLLRIREDVEKKDGGPPEPESRRPKRTQDLSPQIQTLISDIERSADSQRPYTAADIRRILQRNYRQDLVEHHGRETISEDTVRKYMTAKPPAAEKNKEHERGGFQYPEPFQQVAIDTSHFKLFGFTFYLITVFELSGRLNLVTRVFLRERTEEVLSVLEEYLERFVGLSVVVMDRGKPYLNDEVNAILLRHGRLRLVAPPETPTAKAAAERHFATLKAALRPAIQAVFPENPGWKKDKLSKLLEFGAQVFAQLYHQIPQEGIDGKTPAERIASFDPERRAMLLVSLLERARDAEPADAYAREIHQRFQLPGSVGETVKRLRPFGTRALSAVVEDVGRYLGPPFPEWMYDPLGFIAARASERSRRDRQERAEEIHRRERERAARQEENARRQALETERLERGEHPERFIEARLGTLLKCAETGFQAGLKLLAKDLGPLLGGLRQKLGSAFASEVERLKERLRTLATTAEAAEVALRYLEQLLRNYTLDPLATTKT
jgi:hypothetical protein